MELPKGAVEYLERNEEVLLKSLEHINKLIDGLREEVKKYD